MNQQIVAYITAARARGMSDQEIKKELLATGWHEAAIGEGFDSLSAPLTAPKPSAVADQTVTKKKMDPFGKLFRDAWHFYRERIWILAGIMAVPAVVSIAGQIVIVAGGPSFVGVFLELVSLVLYFIAFITVIVQVVNDGSVRESLRKGMGIFWPFLWIGILVMVTMFGGFVLLVVPGILMATWFVFSQYILVVEGKRGMAALAESRAYAKGYWWAIFGRYLLAGLIVGIISSVVSALFTAPFGKTAGTMISGVLAMFTSPFMAVYLYFLYKNIAALKPEVVTANHKTTFFRVSAVIGLLSPIFIIALVAIIAARAIVTGKLGGTSLRSIEPQAAAIAGAADPNDASDIGMIQQRELIGKTKAEAWQSDAEFSGYSEVLVSPSNGTSSNDVEFRYTSPLAKMVYSVSFMNDSTNIAQTDVSQDFSSSTKPLDLTGISVGPQKAKKIALLVPAVQTFQSAHTDYLFLAQLNGSFPGYWYLTLSSGFGSSSSSLVEVLVDTKTGEVLTPIDWFVRQISNMKQSTAK